MGTVVIAAGTNLGDRESHLKKASAFLETLSVTSVVKSPVYETDPVGAADQPFLNCVAKIETKSDPQTLLSALKKFEVSCGRDPDAPRWSNRPIDLDIITFDNLILAEGALTIPHPSYCERRFVLIPLHDILPDFRDPETGADISTLISRSPQMRVFKTNVKW